VNERNNLNESNQYMDLIISLLKCIQKIVPFFEEKFISIFYEFVRICISLIDLLNILLTIKDQDNSQRIETSIKIILKVVSSFLKFVSHNSLSFGISPQKLLLLIDNFSNFSTKDFLLKDKFQLYWETFITHSQYILPIHLSTESISYGLLELNNLFLRSITNSYLNSSSLKSTLQWQFSTIYRLTQYPQYMKEFLKNLYLNIYYLKLLLLIYPLYSSDNLMDKEIIFILNGIAVAVLMNLLDQDQHEDFKEILISPVITSLNQRTIKTGPAEGDFGEINRIALKIQLILLKEKISSINKK